MAAKCGCAPERTIQEEAQRQHAVELELVRLRTAHAAKVAAEQEARAAHLASLLSLPAVVPVSADSEPEPEFFSAATDDRHAPSTGADPFAPTVGLA